MVAHALQVAEAAYPHRPFEIHCVQPLAQPAQPAQLAQLAEPEPSTGQLIGGIITRSPGARARLGLGTCHNEHGVADDLVTTNSKASASGTSTAHGCDNCPDALGAPRSSILHAIGTSTPSEDFLQPPLEQLGRISTPCDGGAVMRRNTRDARVRSGFD
jgi:hypothetical protein